MSSFFRSQEMSLYYLLAPREGIYRLMSSLGELGLFHFLDADPHVPQLSRLYYKQIRRCEELLRQIHEIKSIMETYQYPHGINQGNPEVFLNLIAMKHKTRRSQEEHFIDELEEEIPITLRDIQHQNQSSQDIHFKMTKLIEEILCLEDIGSAFLDGFHDHDVIDQSVGERKVHIRRLIGTINTMEALRFQKSIFRTSKGNCLLILKQLEFTHKDRILDPVNQKEHTHRSYFLIVFSSSASNFLQNRILKICSAYNADLLSCNEDLESGKTTVEQMIAYRVEELARNKELLALTYKQLDRLFQNLQGSTDNITKLEQLRLTLIREKLIYQQINLTKSTGAVLKGAVWIPKQDEDIVLSYLQETQDPKYATAQLYPVPEAEFQQLTGEEGLKVPTMISTNAFTGVFQEIVNTYGVPRYREINPGFFTVITFPFLFGVMFGDIGHGLLLLSFGVYLMASNPSTPSLTNNSSTQSELYRCKYLILLMGFFASYCGFIYNDFMSVPLQISGTCYKLNNSTKQLSLKSDNCVVPFGIDVAWLDAKNSLTYYNSFKMKTAIILGVAQMTLGVLLKGLNAMLQVNPVDFFFEFIPQIAFLLSTFGYLVLLIIAKWLTAYDDNLGMSPSILTAMLNFPLKLGQVDRNQPNLLEVFGYSHKEQENLQIILLTIALISIPLMLFPKPLILAMAGVKRKDDYEEFSESTNRDHTIQTGSTHKKHHSHNNTHHSHDHDLSEVFVHQMIESIEFVLGSISHTASYLRLWALSLAHSQLSAVFFEKTLLSSIESSSILGIMLGFFVFAMISFAVLMCMDVMECFLHTLRLHWVEFQSKFYKADGVIFEPLSFKEQLKKEKMQ